MAADSNDPTIVALLEALNLKSCSAHSRQTAARNLGRMGAAAAPAVPALVAALDDPVDQVCLEIAKALGRIGSSAMPRLLEALQAAHGPFRLTLLVALGEIGPGAEAAVPRLIELLEDEDPTVRREAALTLGQIGSAARDAIPALLRAGEDEFVSAEADEALKNIRRGPLADFFRVHQPNLRWICAGVILLVILGTLYGFISQPRAAASSSLLAPGATTAVALVWSTLGATFGAVLGVQVRGRPGAWVGAVLLGLAGVVTAPLVSARLATALEPIVKVLSLP